MSNRIVFVHGSPRKNGNTRAVTAIAMAAAKESGAEVAEIDAVNLKYTVPGCIGCQKCQDSEAFACAFDDEIAQNVATLPKYDVIVLSCPLYWWRKTLRDRSLIIWLCICSNCIPICFTIRLISVRAIISFANSVLSFPMAVHGINKKRQIAHIIVFIFLLSFFHVSDHIFKRLSRYGTYGRENTGVVDTHNRTVLIHSEPGK